MRLISLRPGRSGLLSVLLLALMLVAAPALAASFATTRDETPPDPGSAEVDESDPESDPADPADPADAAAEPDPAEGDEGTPDSKSAAAEEAEAEPDVAPAPQRPLTQNELNREIDILQRDFEELILRIGKNEPTDKQRLQLHDLAAKLADYRKQLGSVKDSDAIKARGEGFRARWLRLRQALQDFTRYDVKDGMFRIQFGARFQVDATVGTESNALQAQVGSIDESVNIRRGRVFTFGRLFRRYDFMFEYDFAADKGLKDAYFEGVKFTKYVKWRLGHFREPFSLSRQTSSFNIGMLELPLPVQALTPGRNLGIMFRHTEANNRMFWAVSVTTKGKETDDNRLGGEITFTGRVTGLPLYRHQGKSLLHIGASYSLRDLTDDLAQVGARPEARFSPFFIDTGEFSADSATLIGVEVAMVRGSYWAQGEWIGSDTETSDGSNPSFEGAYVEMGWFLTGESRFYRTQDGTFGRITPNRLFHGGNPFSRRSDGGALEFTGRISTLDLNSGPITGGEMHDISVGMNWYLNQTSRLMLNVIRSDVQDVGTADLVLLRFQFNP